MRTTRVEVHAGQIVLLLAHCDFHGLRLILARLLNVAECDELLQHGLRRSRVHSQIAGMHAAFSGLVLPAGNARDLRRFLEGLNQNAAVHIFADWQAKQS